MSNSHQVPKCPILFPDTTRCVVAIAAPKPFVIWIVNVNHVSVRSSLKQKPTVRD